MTDKKIGYALCGSFCTIEKSLAQMELLHQNGADLTPILSPIVYETDTRFFKSQEIKERIKALTERPIIHTVREAEPIGPKKLLDLLIICPCTGNTIAKLANGLTDTAVTMAAKAHLRNGCPLLLGIATNDALSNSAQNIGKLLNMKNVYFIPFGQDDPHGKPTSIICDFNQLLPAAKAALNGQQLQPILC